jgi:DNA-binding MarR family transcriptional regulator
MRTTDLAHAAGITKQSMAYLVTDLGDRGYVEITPDPHDGRAKIVRLTPSGQKAQIAAARISAELETEWAATIGEKQWAQARQTLHLLSKKLEEEGFTSRSDV